jgi:hypothetical protein
MFYKKSPKPLFLITLIFFLIIPFRLLTANPPEPPLTAPLPAKAGAQSVTPEWLLSLPNLSDVKPFIQWIDKDRIIYSLPSLENEQKEKIELIDIKTGKHTYLGQGSFAKPSPDGKWIVFVRGEGKDRQLWIMQSDGSQVKQLSYLPEGLGF